MPNAYVAKTGYTYSLVLSGPSTMQVNSSIAVTASYRRENTGRTGSPADTSLTWTATIDGSPVNLRLGGTGAYSASVTSEVSDTGSYWESSVDVDFENTGTDKTVILTVSGSIAGSDVSDELSIEITDFSLVVTASTPMFLDETTSVVASLRDQATQKTPEPSIKTVTWTANLDSRVVPIRWAGSGAEWANSITSTLADAGAYWESSGEIEILFYSTDGERTITITGVATAGGYSVSDSGDVLGIGGIRISYRVKMITEEVASPPTQQAWQMICQYAQVSGVPSWSKWFWSYMTAAAPNWIPQTGTSNEAGTDPGNVYDVMIATHLDGGTDPQPTGTGIGILDLDIVPKIKDVTYSIKANIKAAGVAGTGKFKINYYCITTVMRGHQIDSMSDASDWKTVALYPANRGPEITIDADGYITQILGA